MTKINQHILTCGGAGCRASESLELVDKLNEELKNTGLDENVKVIESGCFGICEKGPIVKVIPDNTFYTQVKPRDAKTIVNEHILKGRKVEKLLYKDPNSNEKVEESKSISFYKRQLRIALRNCGFIDPKNIEEYIARDGYEAFGKVLTEYTPEQVVDVIKKSGLRGRGGGGFPTGLKWETTANTPSDEKYVVCNADEGNPGAFMDRSILEGDPHSVIEAMAICGYAVGANKGIVYIRREYTLAIECVKNAISQAEAMGLIGDDIYGTGYSFNIEMRYSLGAFISGEETALIQTMEGKRSEPQLKPPVPAVSGYFGKPTNINNVETYANIPVIINKGHEWFSSIGTENSKGTKILALGGKINNNGFVEVPFGTTLRDIIFDIGGGIPNNKKFKAVQIGGPTGGCLTEEYLDMTFDYDSLIEVGTMLGIGGISVLDEDDCIVETVKSYLEFSVEESCGKCSPCRIGNKRLLENYQKIISGNGTEEDLDILQNLADVIKDSSLCGLGQTSPIPVLSSLNLFRDEYLEHVNEGKCRAGVCKSMVKYFILEEECIGCTACARVCPTGAISGNKKEPHVISQDLCIKCGACMDKCKFSSIELRS